MNKITKLSQYLESDFTFFSGSGKMFNQINLTAAKLTNKWQTSLQLHSIIIHGSM